MTQTRGIDRKLSFQFRDFNLEGFVNLAKIYPQDFDLREVTRDLDKDLCLYVRS